MNNSKITKNRIIVSIAVLLAVLLPFTVVLTYISYSDLDLRNLAGTNGEEYTSSPLIHSITPENNSLTTDYTPTISAYFTPSRNSEVKTDSINVFIDNIDLKLNVHFTYDQNGFIYIPRTDLNPGKHNIQASFEDTSGKTTSMTWSFTIPDTKSNNTGINGNATANRGIGIYTSGIIVIVLITVITIITYITAKKFQSDRASQMFIRA